MARWCGANISARSRITLSDVAKRIRDGRLPPELVVSGMTDLQIVEESLRGEGITREHISAGKDQLRTSYIAEMKRAIRDGAHVIEAIPGARAALEAVHKSPALSFGLLTGNIEPAAHLKVESVGLAEFFTLPAPLVTNPSIVAICRPKPLSESMNISAPALEPEQFIVIGDTPNDVACCAALWCAGDFSGDRRMHSAADLQACNPDALLTDFLDVERLCRRWRAL
jgi:phosphoglycolate phosphatase-like HAD superfamily hydrolase